MLLKVNAMTWDEAERTGQRHVTVCKDGKNLMAVLAHFQQGSWESLVVPMGYSYDSTEVLDFIEFFEKLPVLMKFLESPEVLTADDMNKFIDSTF